MAFTLGATALGTSALATTVPRNPPTVTVDAPTGVISAPTITPAWTYNSLISRPQNHFRVVLQSGGSTLYDSGLMPGAAASYALAYVLSAYTSYRVIVGVSDGYDGGADPILFSSGWGFSDFSTGEIIDVPAVNEAVGTIYEIGINGVGYMLDDTPDRPIVRQAVHLEGERLVTAARAQIQQEVGQAREALRREVAVLAVAGAKQILEREIDPKTHAELLERVAKQLN